MLQYTTAKTDEDLKGILALQKANVPAALSEEEMCSQGFVTIIHSYEALRKMNEIEPHVIAKQEGQVVAYLLAMTPASQNAVPVLKPMFDVFNRIMINNRPVSSFNFIVVGQVCVHKAFRGQGILDECYSFYKETFRSKYSFAITEIAIRNTRSISAHKRIGFEEIYQYTAPDGKEWSIVICNW